MRCRNTKALLADCRAGIAILFAFALLPLLLLVGGTTDYVLAMRDQGTLQQSVDAAVLAAARQLGRSDQQITDTATDYVNAGKFIDLNLSRLDVNIEPDGTAVELFASANVGSNFLQLVGIDQLPVAASARAEVAKNYVDVHFVVDRSLSMGLPSEPGMVAPVVEDWQYGSPAYCFFTCHDDGSASRDQGIEIKIDSVQDAVFDVIDALYAVNRNNVDYHLHMFNDSFETVVERKSNPDAIRAQFGDPIALNHASNLNLALTEINNIISSVGRGKRTDDRLQVIVFVSDGDHRRAPAPFDSSLCQAINQRGIQLFTVYIHNSASGFDNPNSSITPNWDSILDGGLDGYGYASGINGAENLMRDCASSASMAHRGEFRSEIQAAFDAIANELATRNLRLTR